MGIQVHFKGASAIKSLLVACRNKSDIIQKTGVICRYKCEKLKCDVEYIGESAGTFGESLKEHFRTPSSIYDCANTAVHLTRPDNFSTVGRNHITSPRPSRRLCT